MSRRLGSMHVAMAAVAAGLLMAPPGAEAATTCDLGGQVLDVAMSASGDVASLDVANGTIFVQDKTGVVPCTNGTPTPTNTAAISVHSANGLTGNVVKVFHADAFAPGPATEPGENGGTPEIEITVNLFDGAGSELQVGASIGGRNLIAGTNGINTNFSASEVQPDVDIFTNEVPLLRLLGNSGNDTLSAAGGIQGGRDTATGGPRSDGVVVDGKSGNDTLIGGEGPDFLQDAAGINTLRGMGDADTLSPGATGADSMDGGAGVDTASYAGQSVGASVDLALPGPQGTGSSFGDSFANVENVVGTNGGDVLRGDNGPNRLDGGSGEDVLEGRGGQDTLDAGNDDDTLDVRDDGPDAADCGAGTDTVTADLPGIDTLLNCETTVFPATATGAAEGGGPAAVTDTLAPFFSGKSKADPGKFEVDPKGKRETAVTTAKKGTRFKFTLSEAATVTFAIEKKSVGRRVKGKCVKKSKANANNRKCNLFKRVGAFRSPGVAGPNKKRFSGRIGKTTLKPGGYRALLTAVDAAGNRSPSPAKISFKVLRPSKKG